MSVSESMNRDGFKFCIFNYASEPATRFRGGEESTFSIIKYSTVIIVFFQSNRISKVLSLIEMVLLDASFLIDLDPCCYL